MPESRAISLLKGVVATKVTVAREVVRLLGELRTEESFQELLAWNDRPLHCDVKVALLRAMWDHLDKEQAWEYWTRQLDRKTPPWRRWPGELRPND